MPFPTTNSRGDTRLWKWKKILGVFQNLAGALAINNPKRGDTWRMTKVKVLRACVGSSAPAAPSGLSIQNLGNISAQWDWVNNSNLQTKVELWLNLNSAGYALAQTLGPTATDAISGAYNPGDNVCGKVRACNGNTCSAFSNEVCLTF